MLSVVYSTILVNVVDDGGVEGVNKSQPRTEWLYTQVLKDEKKLCWFLS